MRETSKCWIIFCKFCSYITYFYVSEDNGFLLSKWVLPDHFQTLEMGNDISEILSSPLDTLNFSVFLFGNLTLFIVKNIRQADSKHVL